MDKRHFIARRAARYFKSGDVVNLGIGIPSLCSDYAEPGVLFQSENGFIGVGTIAQDLAVNERMYNAGGIPYQAALGGCACDVAMSFGVIRSGRMAASVLGVLQVSENGDLANWASPGRAFGMGGAMDLCVGVRQVIVAMELCAKDGRPKIVRQCSYPLTASHCVSHIVTEYGVIDVTAQGLVLSEIAPDTTPEQIQEKIEPHLLIAEDLKLMQ